jgi:hypothetical protein
MKLHAWRLELVRATENIRYVTTQEIDNFYRKRFYVSLNKSVYKLLY